MPSFLLVLVHSPVDVQVESPSGEKIGKDFSTNGEFNQVENAYYTGFDTNSEFITIPNPEEGKYKINPDVNIPFKHGMHLLVLGETEKMAKVFK